MDKTDRIRTYREFWPFYLSQHTRRLTRIIHVVGTSLGIGTAALMLASGNPWGLAAGVVIAYGFAWTAHFFIERNRPATWTYPLWSLISDFRMAFLVITGKL